MQKIISTFFFAAAFMFVAIAAIGIQLREISLAQGVLCLFFFIALFFVGLLVKHWPEETKLDTTPEKETVWNTKDDDFRNSELLAMDGEADRAAELPAWFLHLRSPFEADQSARSWFGGLPLLPIAHAWPRDPDGRPMHFVLQIDLGALSEPKPVKLNDSGALLLFVSFLRQDAGSYRVVQLTEEQMQKAQPRQAPEDLPDLNDAGFFDLGKTFPRWALDLHYEMDAGEDRAVIDPPAEEWITNWGIAAGEAQRVAYNRTYDDKWRQEFDQKMSQRDENSPPLEGHDKRMAQHYAAMERFGPEFFEAFDQFVAKAEAMPPDTPIDQDELKSILEKRRAFAEQLGEFSIKWALAPSQDTFISQQLRAHVKNRKGGFEKDDLADIPSYLQCVLSDVLTGYRFHRLFGRALPPSTHPVELRGMDCLITFRSDDALGILREHEHGFSIWCLREDMSEGFFETGKLVWHTSV
ncbi:DUF1963 domain-containing protein [Ruegeria lacuscaerulensis]|uniref:DUF1963 domain-containing protein n=1 Tax=Ruegeria lacuscaerulensis TaxID=55218 RepID=UPI001479B722|nr:DUF1963 domain-containing protein [Ruegeria lacuscaerulensis]